MVDCDFQPRSGLRIEPTAQAVGISEQRTSPGGAKDRLSYNLVTQAPAVGPYLRFLARKRNCALDRSRPGIARDRETHRPWLIAISSRGAALRIEPTAQAVEISEQR